MNIPYRIIRSDRKTIAIQISQAEAQEEIGKYDELLKYNNEMKKLASGQLDSLYEQIKEKTQSIEETTEALENQEQAFLDRMVAVYMEEDTDVLELLFESENLTDFLSRMELASAVFDYDSRIINGLTDFCHPCQVLADLMTIREHKAVLEGLKMCYIGDGNNMANSLLVGAIKTGMSFAIACPKGYEPDADLMKWASETGEFLCTESVEEAATLEPSKQNLIVSIDRKGRGGKHKNFRHRAQTRPAEKDI